MDFSSVPGLSGWSFPVTYQRGILYPLCILLAKLGAAVSPIDKLRKDSALPPVTSEKPTLFFRVARVVGLETTNQTSYIMGLFFAWIRRFPYIIFPYASGIFQIFT